MSATTLIAATLTFVDAVAFSSAALADPAVAGTYNSLAPTRIVDSRAAAGLPHAIGARQTLSFDAVSRIPGHSASAVALTVTALAPPKGGYLKVFATGTRRPSGSALNYRPNEDTPNEVVTRVGRGGRVSVFNNSGGAIGLLVDISGYWTSGKVSAGTGGALQPLASPTRVYDTRTAGRRPVASQGSIPVRIAGRGGVPASGVTAVAANITVARPARGGSVTILATATDPQSIRTSALHFHAHDSEAGLVMVPLSTGGNISITNYSAAGVDLVVDVEGYFLDGTPAADGAYIASTPYRAADTRTSPGRPVPARGIAVVPLVPDLGGLSLFKAAVVSVTETGPTRPGHLTLWNGTTRRPVVSTSSFFAGETWTTTAIVPISSKGTFSIYNGSSGTVHLVVDVQGFLLNDLSTPAGVRAARVHHALAAARSFAAKQVSA